MKYFSNAWGGESQNNNEFQNKSKNKDWDLNTKSSKIITNELTGNTVAAQSRLHVSRQ